MIFSFFILLVFSVSAFYFLYRKYEIRNMYVNYIYILLVFFNLRVFPLVFGLDFIFPPYIVHWPVEGMDYLVGIVGFMIWVSVFMMMPIHVNQERTETYLHENKNKLAIDITLVVLSLISVIFFLLALRGAGGVSNLIYYVRINSDFEYGFMSNIPSLTLMLCSVRVSTFRFNLICTLLIVLLTVMHILLGDRSGIIFSFFIYFMVVYNQNKINKVALYAALPVGVLIAYALKFYRSVMQLNIYVKEESFWRSIASGLNLNVFDAYFVSINYINNNIPLRLGYDFWLGFVGLIPRFLWQDKPEVINTGVYFVQIFTNLQMGTPISALGEWFLNFHYFGFLLGPVVTYLLISVLMKTSSMFGKLSFGIGLIFLLQIVQTGFTNTTIREMFLFYFLIVLPMFVFRFVRLKL